MGTSTMSFTQTGSVNLVANKICLECHLMTLKWSLIITTGRCLHLLNSSYYNEVINNDTFHVDMEYI